jgi:hypothetical protein
LSSCFDRRDLGVVADQAADLAHERPGDHVHAAHRLEDRGLELVDLAESEAIPHPRTQDLGKRERLGRHRLVHQAAARIALIAAPVAAQLPGLVGVVVVERAPLTQRLQQQLLVLGGDRLIELVLAHRLGEEFGHTAVEVREYVAQALRLAAEGIPCVQIGVVVDLDERFEADAQALAVVEDAAMVIGNPPRSWIEV